METASTAAKEVTKSTSAERKKRDQANASQTTETKNGENDRQTTIQLPISMPNLQLHWTFSARLQDKRTKGASAYRNVPYDKQNTEDNRQFRREFKTSRKPMPLKEMTVHPETSHFIRQWKWRILKTNRATSTKINFEEARQ